ncbi:MAG TPA: SRPBCC family protein [Solirubrobacteraceae bacterium]|jgi:uncharacterized membrane protein
MGIARATLVVDGPISAVEALWYEPDRWPSWIDGFGHVVRLDPGWPGPGAILDWDSRRGGRGRVQERVTAHEQRTGQTLAVEDTQLRGTQAVAFADAGEGAVQVTLSLEYSLKERTAFTPIVDRLFIRRAITASLQRSLARFARERAADVDLR